MVAEEPVVGAVLPPAPVARARRDARRHPAARPVHESRIVDDRVGVYDAGGQTGYPSEDLERRGTRLPADDRAVEERIVRPVGYEAVVRGEFLFAGDAADEQLRVEV